jgi:hypothetical protein
VCTHDKRWLQGELAMQADKNGILRRHRAYQDVKKGAVDLGSSRDDWSDIGTDDVGNEMDISWNGPSQLPKMRVFSTAGCAICLHSVQRGGQRPGLWRACPIMGQMQEPPASGPAGGPLCFSSLVDY